MLMSTPEEWLAWFSGRVRLESDGEACYSLTVAGPLPLLTSIILRMSSAASFEQFFNRTLLEVGVVIVNLMKSLLIGYAKPNPSGSTDGHPKISFLPVTFKATELIPLTCSKTKPVKIF
jgi:hypothetical protein